MSLLISVVHRGSNSLVFFIICLNVAHDELASCAEREGGTGGLISVPAQVYNVLGSLNKQLSIHASWRSHA